MFSRVFGEASPAAPPQTFAIPAGKRVYAVGDIHGRLDLLERLLTVIAADDAARVPADTLVIFLGDLIDRGPDPAGVVERLLRLSETSLSTRFLLGNHEEVFLSALSGNMAALKFLHRIGGDTTIKSYGMSDAAYAEAGFDELMAFLQQAVPPAHATFLQNFEDQIVVGDYAFVHAGIRPGKPLEQQKVEDLRWIRDAFLDSDRPFGKMIVHGHTIGIEVEQRSNRIGLDTGAYVSGRLTAMGFEQEERWTLQASVAVEREHARRAVAP